jgi:hypothetical protein
MATYRGQTDETTQVTLPSAIEIVVWDRPCAAPGARVGLDVRTRFVSNGAQAQVQLRDGSGQTHRTFAEGITAGRLRADVLVPRNARDSLTAEVRLPRHGLQAVSPPLPLTPPITVRDVTWQKDGGEATEARRGDILTLTAAVDGAPDGLEAEIAIFEHDADDAHDLITRFPVIVRHEQVEAEWEFEYHEDTDDIPTENEDPDGYRPPEYFFEVDVGGVRAESEPVVFQDWVEFVFRDAYGTPRQDIEEVVLQLPDGSERREPVGPTGRVQLDDLPPGRTHIRDYVFADSDP